MLTRVRLPHIPAPSLPGVYLVVGILAGIALGPLFYKALIAERSPESIIAVGTIALAAATVYLGFQTQALARDAVNSGRLADMHHQQALSGLLVVLGARVNFHLHTNSMGVYSVLTITDAFECRRRRCARHIHHGET